MSRRKNFLIRQAQAAIAEHWQNLDYDTKVLYYRTQAAVRHLNSDQLALVVLWGLVKDRPPK